MRFAFCLAAAQLVCVGQQAPGQAQFGQGLTLHSSGRYDEAIASFQEALRANFNPPGAMMRIARAFSMKNDVPQSIEWLQRAADGGFATLALIQNDIDFNNARGDARFARILKQIDLNGKPCLTNPKYREFDFWVGDWSVAVAGGPSGDNDVIPLLDGCAIMENWLPVNGNRNRGKSFNFFDTNTNKWRQIYLSDTGTVAEFSGEIVDGAMVFHREYVRSGRRILERMSFTPLESGQVRQLWELSTDAGATWAPLFDGLYSRRRGN